MAMQSYGCIMYNICKDELEYSTTTYRNLLPSKLGPIFVSLYASLNFFMKCIYMNKIYSRTLIENLSHIMFFFPF